MSETTADPCQGRHKGNEQSQQAFQFEVLPSLQRTEAKLLVIIVLRFKCNQKTTGKTLVELLGKPHHKFSGRITALKSKGMIEVEIDHKTGKAKTIDGAAVLVPTMKGMGKYDEIK